MFFDQCDSAIRTHNLFAIHRGRYHPRRPKGITYLTQPKNNPRSMVDLVQHPSEVLTFVLVSCAPPTRTLLPLPALLLPTTHASSELPHPMRAPYLTPHQREQASWSRLCHDGGRPGAGRHIGQVVRSTSSPSSSVVATATGAFRYHTTATGDKEGERQPRQEQEQQQRQPLTWEDEYPRSRYRGDFFKPPLFDDEPSDSDDDESHQPGGAAGSN